MSFKRTYVIFCMLLVSLMLVSCASSKATLDMTMNQRIVWPGMPEKPRIQYLWSLSQVAGAEASGLIESIAGSEDTFSYGPRYSNFLLNPHGVFVSEKNILYVTDVGAGRVSVVDLNTLESFDILGDRGFMLVTPIAVAADLDGNIYVTDSELRRVVVFSARGKFIRFFEGTFKRPTGLAIDNSNKRIYVADTWAHMVHVYSFDGHRLSSIGGGPIGEESLNYPTHIALDSEGALHIADTLNFKVKVFSVDGDLVTSFGFLGDSYSFFDKIKGIAVDGDGNIYVSDSTQDMVKIFDRQGRLLLFFGGKGSFYGQFSHPAGIYIDSTDRIFVTDMLNRRVQAFQFLGGG